jgi:hypothetical protein
LRILKSGADLDIFLYNGNITRGADLRFINKVAGEQDADECIVLLVTNGGDPDAAYKMARYLQYRYKSYSVLIPGMCKSAGTLFSIGANEVIFAPYGELGPLDIQLMKTDHLAGMESGLNISEALKALDSRAKEHFIDITLNIIGSSAGVVSFQTASHSASELVGALYGPVFARIDPEEVGSRSRAMRIGEDYGRRLNLKWNNMREDALGLLSQTYPSHAFVIDYLEACSLFNRVRLANELEMALIDRLGEAARHPQANLTIEKLQITPTGDDRGDGHDEAANDSRQEARINVNGFDSETAVEAQSSPASRRKAAPAARE